MTEEDKIAEIAEILQGDKLIGKYINRTPWISGSSTVVYPIQIWAVSKIVEIQVLKGAYRLRHRIDKIVSEHPDIFSVALFCESDGSCPDTIKFWYK